MQVCTNCNRLPSRTIEMYDQQARMVENNELLRTVYGINHNSAFNELNFFHVVGGIPSDLAHDLFEGVVPQVMTHVIKYLVQSGFFSLNYLNGQITDFFIFRH